VGYRGKLEERAQARELRAQAWTMPEIAEHLGVSRSSVSLWTRDVPFDPSARRSARTDRRPRGSDHPLRRRKLEQIAHFDAEGRARLARLSDRELLVAGVALYAGEGSEDRGVCVHGEHEPAAAALLRDVAAPVLRGRPRCRSTCTRGSTSTRPAPACRRTQTSPTGRPDASIRHNKHGTVRHVAYCTAPTHRPRMAALLVRRQRTGHQRQPLVARRGAPGAGLEPATTHLTGGCSAN
jgi:hypothetical protein